MKYTLNVYGWEGEFICKTLSTNETITINNLMEEIGTNDPSEVRFDLEYSIDNFDIYDGDILHKSCPLNNGTCHFELYNEEGNLVLTFNIDDITQTEDDNEYDIQVSHDKNIYFSVDESKGGIHSYEIESGSKIYPFDFTWKQGLIFLPNGEYWSFIDSFQFRGEELEIYDHLDNYGKSSTLQIFQEEY